MFKDFLNRFKLGKNNDMPKAKISWKSTTPHQIYTSPLPSYSWVSIANKSGTRTQLSDFATCRESFIHWLRGRIEEENIKVPINRVVFLMGRSVRYDAGPSVIEKFRKKFFKDIRCGVKLVNIIEAHYGWTRTKMYHVNSIKPNGLAFLITGPSRWMRAPQLLSFYTLILRLGRFSEFDNVNTFRGFCQVSEKFTTARRRGEEDNSDRIFMKMCGPYWRLLIENMDSLYKGKDLSRTYSSSHLNQSSGFSEGIHSLCSGNSADRELKKAWANLVKTQAGG